MGQLEIEYFTDPLSHRCWAVESTVRRLAFTYGDVEWTPRFVPRFDDERDLRPDAESISELNDRCRNAVGSRTPIADPVWPEDAVPSSRAACGALAALREHDPDVDGRPPDVRSDGPSLTELFLRRLRERTFLEGDPPTSRSSVVDVARALPGIDTAALARQLDRWFDEGVPEELLAADRTRARDAAALAHRVDTRGTIRVIGAGSDTKRTDGTSDSSGEVPAESERDERDALEGDDTDGTTDEGTDETTGEESDETTGEGSGDETTDEESDDGRDPGIVAPPTIRFESPTGTVIANPEAGFMLLKDAANQLDPNLRNTARIEAPYGTEELKSRGLSPELAEQFVDEDFEGRTERYLVRFHRALLPEIVESVDATRNTCRLALYQLQTDGKITRETVGETTVWRRNR